MISVALFLILDYADNVWTSGFLSLRVCSGERPEVCEIFRWVSCTCSNFQRAIMYQDTTWRQCHNHFRSWDLHKWSRWEVMTRKANMVLAKVSRNLLLNHLFRKAHGLPKISGSETKRNARQLPHLPLDWTLNESLGEIQHLSYEFVNMRCIENPCRRHEL